MNPIECEQICNSAQQALIHGSITLHQFPKMLRRIIKERLWEKRKVPGHGIVELNSFREFITRKPRIGWGEDITKIEAVIHDEPDVLAMWREAITNKPHRPSKEESNDNIITSSQGTSLSYTLSRLKNQHPELYARVVAKELSAHAAAKLAGFRKEKTALEWLNHWWEKATEDDKLKFMAECGIRCRS